MPGGCDGRRRTDIFGLGWQRQVGRTQSHPQATDTMPLESQDTLIWVLKRRLPKMLHLQFQNGLDHNFWLSHPTPLRDFVLPMTSAISLCLLDISPWCPTMPKTDFLTPPAQSGPPLPSAPLLSSYLREGVHRASSPPLCELHTPASPFSKLRPGESPSGIFVCLEQHN